MKGKGVGAGAFDLFLKATYLLTPSLGPGILLAWRPVPQRPEHSLPFLPGQKRMLCQWTFHHGSQKNMPSQGILHELSLNVSPATTQRLGVVPAFCEPGVVALHGTEAPRAWGGRMQEATGPEGLLWGKGGCLPDSFWRTGSIRPSYSCVSKWRVVDPVVLHEHPARECDPCLRMTATAT